MRFDRTQRRRLLGRRFLVEWIAIGCLGVAWILAGVAGRMTASVDRIIYDRLLTLRKLPIESNIVIVEIDNRSLDTLGRWPWQRSVQAEFLGALAKTHPAAVVYDVLFTEPSADDRALAKVLDLVPTFLPVLLSPEEPDGTRTVNPPVPVLAQHVAGAGHINLEVDPDGIVRSVALFESDGLHRWPQLMVPVFHALENGQFKLAQPAPIARRAHDIAQDDNGESRYFVPFSRASQNYPAISFVDVLAGRVNADELRGKIVIVGATASGLYDRFATPISGEFGPLPGVYIHASVLDTLMTGRAISPVSGWLVFSASLLPLVVLLAGFLMLSPWRSLLLTLSLAPLAVAGSAALR